MTKPAALAPRIGRTARNALRKAVATTANALSITVLVTLWLQPMSSGRPFGLTAPFAMAAFVALQGVAHYVLRRVED